MKFDFHNQVISTSDVELLKIYKDHSQYDYSFIKLVEEEIKNRQLNYIPYKPPDDNRNKILDKLVEKGEPGDSTFIIIGFIFALLGGFLGIVAGFVYSRSKHKSLSGNSYYVYDQRTRDFGSAMIFIGIAVFILSLVIKFTD
jgi:hypothetical protein